jgi:hypothetical protein
MGIVAGLSPTQDRDTKHVPACRFYARRGCVLEAAHRSVYSRLPAEIELLWYKDLSEVRLLAPRSGEP